MCVHCDMLCVRVKVCVCVHCDMLCVRVSICISIVICCVC